MSGRRVEYAPAAPFTAATREWIDRYAGIINAQPYHWRAGLRVSVRDHCLRELANRSGMHRQTVRDIADGRMEWLTVRQADRLSLALGVPLPCLAEEFKPLKQWREEVAA